MSLELDEPAIGFEPDFHALKIDSVRTNFEAESELLRPVFAKRLHFG
jgi:hypothetical protein